MTESEQVTESKQPFTGHLDELRNKLLISSASVLIAAVAGYFFSEPILQHLARSITHKGYELHFFHPAEAFLARIKIAVVIGLILASPVILRQIWAFMVPGLYENERKAVLPWTAASVMLFVTGSLFGLFIALPAAVNFLLGFESALLKPVISVSSYISFAAALTVAFGIAFNLPILIVGSVLAGWVKVEVYRKFRRHAYVGVFVASMVLTPPDVYSQVLLAIPMIFLYEASLVIASALKKDKTVK